MSISSEPCLWLIPTSLAAHERAAILPEDLPRIHHVRDFVVETEKTARAALKCLQLQHPIAQLSLACLNEHSKPEDIAPLLQALREGRDLGILSDAGCPVIADPGALLVRLAHQEGFRVIPLVGPSSIVLALMASGAWGQKFMFHGYLPVEEPQCIQKLKSLEQDARKHHAAQLFIETPYRNQKLWERMLQSLHPETYLSIACALTSAQESTRCHSIQEWQALPLPNIHKQPAVFTIFKVL